MDGSPLPRFERARWAKPQSVNWWRATDATSSRTNSWTTSTPARSLVLRVPTETTIGSPVVPADSIVKPVRSNVAYDSP